MTKPPFRPTGGRAQPVKPRGPDRQRTGWRADRPPRPRTEIAGDDRLFLYGSHAVEAALANPRRTISRAWMTENAARRLETALSARSIEVERVSPRDLDRRLGADTVHQGALVEADPLPEVDLAALLGDADGPPGPIVVLDQVTDPHNVGAVLRSAAVFGARGLVMTRRHSPPLSGALAKAASGALDQVPIALVQNLAVALATLRESGAAVVGLDGEATVLLEEAPFGGPTAIVLGAEGKGLRELTRERCTLLVRIGARGPLKSLNVSNAAAIALHFAVYRGRHPD